MQLDLFKTMCYGTLMNKRKVILILAAIIVVLGTWASWYSFSRTQKIAHNTSCEHSITLCVYEIIPPSLWEIITGKTCDGLLCDNLPSNVLGCDQSATTTPCSKITDIKAPIQQPREPAVGFPFGPLVNVYKDKEFGFSLRYPNEISLVDRHEGCIFFVDSPQPKSWLFAIQTPACSSDSKMTSFEDYRKDYEMSGVEDTKLIFHHLSSEAVKTKSGIEGMYQEFSIENSGEQISKRYIFKLPQGGFVIFSKLFDDPKSTYYIPLEKAIIESITFP